MTNKRYDRTQTEFDPLRARFTSWLDTTLYRAKLRFLDREKQKLETIPLDDIYTESIADPCDYFSHIGCSDLDFDFEEEQLAKAFSELPLIRQEILRLLFVEEKTTREISTQLQCTESYVRLQKSRALQQLRKILKEGGEIRYDEQ